jgi:hypothetical protein
MSTITESYSVNKAIINIKSETLLQTFGLGAQDVRAVSDPIMKLTIN